jgi:Mind bomb SH3 repeat domain
MSRSFVISSLLVVLVFKFSTGKSNTSAFRNGNVVMVLDDAQTVQQLQVGHGGWNSQMTQVSEI